MDFDLGYNILSPRDNILKPLNQEKTGIGEESTNSSSFFLLYFIYLSGLTSLSKSDKQAFPVKMAMQSLPSLVSTRVCEGGGGELCVCLCVRSIHSIYEGIPESRLLNLISHISVLQPMKTSQFKTALDM